MADLRAVELGLSINGLVRRQQSRKYREPDRLESPSYELRALTGEQYQKVAGSRDIGRHLDLDNPRSPSFFHLISGIQRMAAELAAIPAQYPH